MLEMITTEWTLDDKYKWLQEQTGITDKAFEDLEVLFLQGELSTTSLDVPEMWREYLEGRGFTGTSLNNSFFNATKVCNQLVGDVSYGMNFNDITIDRASSKFIPDADGNLVEIPPNMPAISGLGVKYGEDVLNTENVSWTQYGESIFNTSNGITNVDAITEFDGVSESINFEDGKSYSISCDIELITASSVRLSLWSNIEYVNTNINNTLEIVFTSDNESAFKIITPSGITGTFNISNVSVREILPNTQGSVYYPTTTGVAQQLPSGYGLLIEPESTNLIEISDDFTKTRGNASVIEKSFEDPFGNNEASKLIGADDISWSGNNFEDAITPCLSNTEYSASVFVKSGGATTVGLGFRDGSTGAYTTSTISLTNEWKRVEVNATSGVSTTILHIMIGDADGDVLVYGLQVEQLPYATSYIPTNGATATRLADNHSHPIDGIVTAEKGAGRIVLEFENTSDVKMLWSSFADGLNSTYLYWDGVKFGFAKKVEGAVHYTVCTPTINTTGRVEIKFFWDNIEGTGITLNNIDSNTDPDTSLTAVGEIEIGNRGGLLQPKATFHSVQLFPSKADADACGWGSY